MSDSVYDLDLSVPAAPTSTLTVSGAKNSSIFSWWTDSPTQPPGTLQVAQPELPEVERQRN